jgi:uncharacterized iron-regulated protein
MFCAFFKLLGERSSLVLGLESYEIVVALIGSTHTESGLDVHATLDEREYQKGVEVSTVEYESINITPSRFHGDWNYVITPRNTSP